MVGVGEGEGCGGWRREEVLVLGRGESGGRGRARRVCGLQRVGVQKNRDVRLCAHFGW